MLFAPQDLHPAFYLTPAIRGDQVAFSCEGDIWVGSLDSRRAIRLTSDVGNEDSPSFSPDGKWIAFHGEYDGMRQAYIMPAGGGAPRRLTNIANFRAVTGFTPDGKSVVFRARGVPTGYQYYTVPANGGAAIQLPFEFVSHVTFGKTGDEMAFTRFPRFFMAWFHYDGGMQNQIWVGKPGTFKQITNQDGTNEFPVWAADSIFFANEKKAQFTVMAVSAVGGKVRKIAGPYAVEVRELDTDGQKLIYEKGHGLEVFDIAKGTAEEVKFDLQSDLLHTREAMVPAERNVRTSSLSPTAKRVFVESRGQILSLPVGEGEARVWKAKPGVRYRSPVMSPDARTVAYFCDESGEMQLMLADSEGNNARPITSGKNRQLVTFDWSPDSKILALFDSTMHLRLIEAATGKETVVGRGANIWRELPHSFSPASKWLAYLQHSPMQQNGMIELLEIATGKRARISSGRSNDRTFAFSTDGKYLAFISDRSLGVQWDSIQNQLNLGKTSVICLVPVSSDYTDPLGAKDPVEGAPITTETPPKIEPDGMMDRRIELPIPPGTYTQVAMVGGRVLYASIGSLSPTGPAIEPSIQFFDLATKTGGTLTMGSSFELSKDGSKALVGPGLRVVETNGKDLALTAGAISMGGLKLRVEPLAEWKQIFWDAWRHLRDYFYVANMHGHDWQKVGDKYAALLPSVRSRSELDNLIRWMQSELGCSHEYLQTGDTRDIKTRIQPSFLGIDVEPGEGGYYKIKRIIRGDGFLVSERSPLARPDLKVKEGEYLIEIAGIAAKVGNDIYQGLEGRAGQVVSIRLNSKPSLEGSRTILVKPAADESRMRYLDWVEKNRQYVLKASGGKIGYLHLAAMSQGDMSDFIRQYYPQRDKEALLIDTRYNNGGNIQELVNRALYMPLGAFFNQRESYESWTRMGDSFIGPIAVLQNEFNISCGEEFPYRFRQLKRGPIIGRRTMGGEVGSDPGWPLIDGGSVSVPNYGMYVPGEGWVIEGKGVEPDIDVPSDPNAYILGRDPQLDKGVEWLMAEARKSPKPRLGPPDDRIRIGGG